mgnify:CR=1 FL=1
MMKKAVVMLVLFLLCSFVFALAEETSAADNAATNTAVESSCNLGCKIWEFLFGNKEARAGNAWFDRSTSLVGQADTLSWGGWVCSGAGSLCVCKDSFGCADNKGKTWFPGEFGGNILYISASDALPANVIAEYQKPKPSSTSELPKSSTTSTTQSASSQATPKPASTPPQPAPTQKPTSTAVWSPTQNVWGDQDGKVYDKDGKTIPNVVYDLKTKEFEPATGYVWQDSEASGNWNVKRISLPTTLDEVQVWKGERTLPEGTVYKNEKGEYFVADIKGVGKKVNQEAALKQLQENAKVSVSAPIDPKAQSKFEDTLGKGTYDQFAKSLKAKEVFERPDGTLVMRGTGGDIIIGKADAEGIQVGSRSTGDGKPLEYYLIKNGQVMATQDDKGNVKVGDTTYTFPSGKTIADSVADLKDGMVLPGKEGPSGFLRLDGDNFVAVDFEKETLQRINTKNKGIENLKGDYYQDGVSGCSNKQGCFVETSGTKLYFDEKIVLD